MTLSYVTPPHRQPQAVFGDMPPVLEGGCCYARSLLWLKRVSHIITQRITTFKCSLGVGAGDSVL